ncbi:TonB family protein [Hymenobacter weizhouensis]|uniref:TonB family protein n=1 Tax=Hymenobacter sp. YIM 151500-1 TaxID=2987689 RepID=UPI0022265720|nr:TonB family protein [Hymenobacter sp. YIM 151500-1]UYZ62383.1 TonB family protein [Hymenobacter sp. YIM 151500-1]
MLPRNPASAPLPTAGHLPVEVLRRYVAGTLPPAEQHRVEAHTLDCPHCADILEGLELQPAQVTEASLHELRQRLTARVEELAEAAEPAARPAVAWPRLAVAAALVLLLSTVAWLAWRPASTSLPVASAPEQARQEPAQPAPMQQEAASDRAAVSAPSAPAAAAPSAVRPPAAPTARAKRAVVARNPPPVRPAGTAPVAAPEAADAVAATREGSVSTVLADTVPVANPAVAASTAAPPRAPQVAERAAFREKQTPVGSGRAAGPARTVRGRITDQVTGQGLPGVTVLVPGTQMGASTAPDGSFQLAVPAATRHLTVSSVGYTSQRHTLRPTDSTLTLALAPDTKTLSEVVVVRREPPPAPMSIGAMPAGGYFSFRRYLRDSLDYPERAIASRIEGTVKLRFEVGTDGKVTNIEVVKKLSEECDAEAIRLLREGPSWFPAVQNGRRVARKVEISVPFKLD